MIDLQQSEATAAQRRIPVVLEDSTGARVTGFTPAGAEIQISKNGAAFGKNGAAFGNYAGTLTELSDGLYYYEATAGELDTVGLLLVKFEKASIRTAFLCHRVVPWDPYDAARQGMTDTIPDGGITSAKFAASAITATSIAAGAITSGKFGSGAIDAAAIGADAITAAKIANGAIDAATFAAGAIDAAAIANSAIDAATFAAGAIDASAIATGAITSAKFAASAIDAAAIATGAITSGKFAAGAIDAAAIAADAITAAKVAADVGTEIAAAVWAYVYEGAVTAQSFLRLAGAVLFGKATGLEGGTHTFRDYADSKDRVVATYAAGARTPTTRDAT
jgi:hypothetical protein